MKQIKMLCKMIREELEDACKYSKEALCHKEDDKDLAEMFYKLANQELDHADMEHSQVVRLIKAYAKAPSEAMQAVYDWEHEQMIEMKSEIKTRLEMFKN